MNVGIVATGPLRARGQGRALAARIAAFRARGDTVRVFAPPDCDLRVVDGLMVHRLSWRDALCERLAGRERSWSAQDAYWVLYDGYDPLLEALRLVADRPIVAEYAGVPVAGRGATEDERVRRARAVAGRKVLALAHRVLVTDAGLGAELEESGIEYSRIVEITPAVVGGGARRAYEGATLVTVGRPAPQRRLDVLVEALARVARVRADARLVVVGPVGDPEARAARDEALGWARALGVMERVRFTGEVDEGEVGRHLDEGIAVFAGAGRRALAVAEAVGRGGAVVADRGCSLARSCGDAAVWVDGSDARAVAGAVLAVAGGGWLEDGDGGRRTETVRAAEVGDAIAWAASHPHRARASLLPLLDLVAGERVVYGEGARWPGVAWVRGKVTRHLLKFFVRRFEENQQRFAAEAIRELRNLRVDVDQLSARLRD